MLMLARPAHFIEITGEVDNVVTWILSGATNVICYFLIVSGYGLYLAYNKERLTWNYLFKRAARLYIALWTVFAIFVFCLGNILYPGRFSMSMSAVIANLTGYKWDYCHFLWFLLPYILMTLCSRWVFWLIDHAGQAVMLFCTGTLYLASSWIISRYYDSWLYCHYPVYHILLVANMFFGLTIGAVMARMFLKGKSLTWRKLQGRNSLVVIIFLLSFVLRGQIHFEPINPFFCTFVVWLVLHLEFPQGIKNVFVELGNKSMLMWFLHGFLGVVLFSEYFAIIKNPVLSWCVWFAVTYIVAGILHPLVDIMAIKIKLR